MPKKRPLNVGDIEYLDKRIKDGYSELLKIKSLWAHYQKKDESLRVELDDLCRRYQVFSAAATKFLIE
jgi:hypothetical protein